MANSEDHVWIQYSPCTCDGPCDERTCLCIRDGNFCERYCACGGSCSNAFTGCACLRGQCHTRACPCFAAARECDPDLCKRCVATAATIAHDAREGWPFTDLCLPVPPPPEVPTEGPNARGDPTESCVNMKLLLRQRKQICLGLSAIAGWGAFLKDGAKKNELLGEYTGELITQVEADRRGKIYDRVNCSFLFNLNDQWCLDAHLKGNKLKFANHSATPNCYAKVLMVRGDHRVGIFAKDNIAPGEELTYDYRDERDKAPAWAQSDEPAGPLVY
jgi:histone-lysine N-methyltransferase EZH2